MAADGEQDRAAALASIELLHPLGEAALAELARRARGVRVFAGELLVRAGDPAASVFALLRGRMQAEGEGGSVLAELGPGSLVGEVTLLAGGHRSADVRALEDSELLEIDAEPLRDALEAHPEALRRLAAEARARLLRSQLVRRLTQLVGSLDPESLARLESEIEWRALGGGECLFRSGDPASGAYVLVSGRLRVSLPEAGGERAIGELVPGEMVGELALLTGEPRTATVTAIRDSELAHVSEATFLRLIASRPTALRQVGRYVVERMRREGGARRAARQQIRALALVPASSRLDLQSFARQLARALGGFGKVRWLSAGHVDAELGRPGIANASGDHPAAIRLTHWLDELEVAHDFLIYQADAEGSAWSERSLRQADHVLLVADSSEPAAPFDHPGGKALADRSLALLHPTQATSYLESARWLDALGVTELHHVRAERSEDFERLARTLTGRALSLVLGGGGARGFAHIGVVRALEELRLPIDLVGGTSMGAIIAGGVAMGLRSAEMLEVCRRLFARIFDPTLPLVALLAGRRIREALESGFGAREIEDLPIPFFCVSTNLSRARETIHARGRLARAVRASISLPGILPPVAAEGDVLVDGGLLNNLPVDVMARRARGGRVIAVDVTPEEDRASFEGELEESVSGWRLLAQRMNPFLRGPQAVPHIASVLMRSTVVASLSRGREQAESASLYLRIPATDWRLLDFRSIDAIAERGYAETLERLRGWSAALSPADPARTR